MSTNFLHNYANWKLIGLVWKNDQSRRTSLFSNPWEVVLKTPEKNKKIAQLDQVTKANQKKIFCLIGVYCIKSLLINWLLCTVQKQNYLYVGFWISFCHGMMGGTDRVCLIRVSRLKFLFMLCSLELVNKFLFLNFRYMIILSFADV